MEIYKASGELVNVLLRHGFIEKTAKLFAGDAQRLNDTAVYDPHTMKRVFAYKRFYYNRIFFDYNNIRILLNNEPIESNLQFTELELRSILTFFSLKSDEKWVLVDKTGFKPSELHLYYSNSMKKLMYPLTNALEKKIIKAFESTVV